MSDVKSHEPLITYAQNREDIIIDAFFPDVKEGFYVDVGANHPVGDSVTKFFYDKGWRGINIEPIKALHKKFEELRPDDTNISIGVSNKSGKANFVEFENGGISTFSEATSKGYKKEAKVRKEYEVKIDTLASILSEHKVGKIHFLKIDIEGYEYEALEGADWKRFRPEIVCIEANHVDRDWRSILEENDYRLVFFDGLNEYYLEKKSAKREEYFKKNFPATLVASPIISFGWHEAIIGISKQLENVQGALDGSNDSNKQLGKDIEIYRAEIKEREAELAKYSKNTYLVKRFFGNTKRMFMPK